MGIFESLVNAFVGTNVAGDTVVEVRRGGRVVITDDGEGHKTRYTVDKDNKTYKKEGGGGLFGSGSGPFGRGG